MRQHERVLQQAGGRIAGPPTVAYGAQPVSWVLECGPGWPQAGKCAVSCGYLRYAIPAGWLPITAWMSYDSH